MKAILPKPVCARCGYKYNPRRPDKRVLIFKCDDGDYTACQDCLTELGALKEQGADEKEINDMILSFKSSGA